MSISVPRLAKRDDAFSLTELICKLWRVTGGFDRGNCEEENRATLTKWLEEKCEEGLFWVLEDDHGPVAKNMATICRLLSGTVWNVTALESGWFASSRKERRFFGPCR